jgi:4-hydroxy-tetrahydrodipicolinate reductase
MGKEAVKTMLQHDTAFELIGLFDRNHEGIRAGYLVGMPEHPCTTKVSYSLTSMIEQAQASTLLPQQRFIVIDLTVAKSTMQHLPQLIEAGGLPVIGATGFSEQDIHTLDTLLKAHRQEGALIPNFSIGAVLLMQFAQKASAYFDHSELIEYHHNQKLDAPSGTAVRTAHMMHETRPQFGTSNVADHETMAGARGCKTQGGLHIHSVRLPGLVAHQEVLFGAAGELLTLRHDSFDRACFMPGVRQVAKALATHTDMDADTYASSCAGLHIGLEHYL